MDHYPQRPPVGLSTGGRALWRAVAKAHELDASQILLLYEACRAKDRLDQLDEIERNGSAWAELPGNAVLTVADAAGLANRTADQLKQLLAALRLPDAHGRRPQRRGTSRGVYRGSGR